jgi:hypothetical protein
MPLRDRRASGQGLGTTLLARPALLLLWALVFWGTLLLFSLVVVLFDAGPREALARLLPLDDHSPWPYMNAACVVLALAAWSLVGFAIWSDRRARASSEP